MSDSFHDNILREQHKSINKKYEVLHILGTGSMGTVSMVKLKDSRIGGSAFKKNSGFVSKVMQKLFKKESSNISDPSERRKVENIYALKSIQLGRVQPMYVDELKNEIAILKSCDHPNIVKAHEVSSVQCSSVCQKTKLSILIILYILEVPNAHALVSLYVRPLFRYTIIRKTFT